ncbi:hypothetical protein DPMN_146314 [Dreissena polymorpha]|uniref:Uncharacterized protein n=1 Tax=Dreissena polymorpha TaxID=45954 RepID=A0A9D4IZL4_DREPO|nr:hypothetical protein DPMN_146314 [Dreissena polymorpha]
MLQKSPAKNGKKKKKKCKRTYIEHQDGSRNVKVAKVNFCIGVSRVVTSVLEYPEL